MSGAGAGPPIFTEIYRCDWCGWEIERASDELWPQCQRCKWEFFVALGLRPNTLMLPVSESTEPPGAALKRFRFKDRSGNHVWTTLPPAS